jgi:homoserine kinase
MAAAETATAFAPASIGNLGVGFDMLGLAIEGAGDRVTARRRPGAEGVVIAEVRGLDGEIHPTLSANTDQNTAGVSARALWSECGDDDGVELVVHKGIPLQSGMGSSAASAVAGCVAVNALLAKPLPLEELLRFALAGEKLASGTMHADNVAPSLLGGLVLCPPVLHPRLIRLDVPDDLSSVLLHPDLLVSTAEARKKLAASYSMDQWLAQQGYFGGFIAALAHNDHELIAECLKDVIIEPQRASAVPCFRDVQTAALEAGALGSSLSGSGPSIFAICASASAERVAGRMQEACRGNGVDCQTWISPMLTPGARVESAA